MPNQTLWEPTPTPFDFEATARAHGWVMLRPFAWHQKTSELSRVHQLDSGQVVLLRMSTGETDADTVRIDIEAARPVSPDGASEVGRAVRRMLRLDEDLGDFYRLKRQLDGQRLQLKPGGGRLLRCPSLFEDMVYTLCTTNIAWSGTIRMVDRLTETLGSPLPGSEEQRAFPTPQAIAAAGADYLKQKTGLGYRSQYVWELARDVAEQRLELAELEAPDLPAEAIYKKVRRLKGFGDYAASTILMLLGRYERLAIDSELRAFVAKKYFNGQPPSSDKEIQAIYEPWGNWRYLAYWFDSPPETG